MYTIKERNDIRVRIIAAFSCDENIAFLERCLLRYFADKGVKKIVSAIIDDLVANFNIEDTFKYADFITTPSVANIVDCANKQFLIHSVRHIQEMIVLERAGRCADTLSSKYVLRDGKLKNRRPMARLIGDEHGSDIPRNDYNEGQPRKQFWRYAKDTSPRVDSWNYPKRVESLRDDDAGVQTYRGSHLADLNGTGTSTGSDYDHGATQYNTDPRMNTHTWRGSGGGCVPRQHYEKLVHPTDEPVYEYGDNVPKSQSQTNEDDGEYHDSLHEGKEMFNAEDGSSHLDRLFSTTMQDLNSPRIWETAKPATDTLFGDGVNYTNNYSTNNRHGSGVESARAHGAFEQRKVFRNDNRLIDRPISRRYERDVEESLGGFEKDYKLYRHDMSSLHCRHSRNPCEARPFNDPFEHRYKSVDEPYLDKNGLPMYYPADREATFTGY
jgi:hypothetical protein